MIRKITRCAVRIFDVLERVAQISTLLFLGAFCTHSTDALEADEARLLCAAHDGSTEIVRELLHTGTSCAIANEQGYTPLMLAAYTGHTDIVALLLKHGALTESIDTMGLTALLYAIEKGHTASVALLLQACASPDSKNSEGTTALMSAAMKGQAAIISLLLPAGANRSIQDIHARTALIIAVEKGYRTCVELLLDESTTDYEKTMALMVAIVNSDKPMMDLLIHKGVHTSDYALAGNTPLICATKMGHVSMATALVNAGVALEKKDPNGFTALLWAVDKGNAALVEILLRARADVHVRDASGNNALLRATEKGDEVIGALLLNVPDIAINETNDDQSTPLLYAVHAGCVKMVSLLLAAGAHINAQNEYGFAPLACAAQAGHASIVSLLLDAGAHTHVRDTKENSTPLMYAAHGGHTECVALLLRAGADKDAVGNKRNSALMFAVTAGHTQVVKALLACGARITTHNDENITLLMIAAYAGYKEIVQLLLAAGAQTEERTSVNHITAAHCALAAQHYALARILNTPLSDYALAIAAISAHKVADVKYFIEERALPIDEACVNGVTLLAAAACQDKNKMVLYLLSKRANPFLATRKGWTPLRLALNKNQKSLSAKLIEKAMVEREKEADLHAQELSEQETQEHVQERVHKERVRALLATGEQAHSTQEREESWIAYTDEDDCDAYTMAHCLRSVKLSPSTHKKLPRTQKGAAVPAKKLTIDASRSAYEPRVNEWFVTPERALERPEYVRCPEPFFPAVIFHHTVARIIDTVTREWGIVDTVDAHTMTVRLYCIIIRYGIREDRILEYGINKQAARTSIYHRFLNKLDKHPGIAERFEIPVEVVPTHQGMLHVAHHLASDGSYIVRMTTDYIEMYDPKNDATIFIAQPK